MLQSMPVHHTFTDFASDCGQSLNRAGPTDPFVLIQAQSGCLEMAANYESERDHAKHVSPTNNERDPDVDLDSLPPQVMMSFATGEFGSILQVSFLPLPLVFVPREREMSS